MCQKLAENEDEMGFRLTETRDKDLSLYILPASGIRINVCDHSAEILYFSVWYFVMLM